MNTKVRITKTQLEILDHRLTAPDCIAEALNDGEEGLRVGDEEVEESAEKLLGLARGGAIDWTELTDLDREVLWDSLDGSTFLGSSEGAAGLTERGWIGLNRSFDNLVDKFEAAGLPKVGR